MELLTYFLQLSLLILSILKTIIELKKITKKDIKKERSGKRSK